MHERRETRRALRRFLEEARGRDTRQARVSLTEALERIVKLYEATNQPNEANKWRTKLEARRKK